MSEYGRPPQVVGKFELDWDEYMHYLYLPIAMPGTDIRLPERLKFLWPVLSTIVSLEKPDHYIYVTARRGYATPGNPLNRPGWHADGFGTNDINFIWCDRYPTRFALGDFGEISDDHVKSAEQFEEAIEYSELIGLKGFEGPIRVQEGVPNLLYRLDPSVIHATPIIHTPGDRSFLKISLSPDKYNLRGNSHNYLFDYDWKMWDRAEIRNDPAYAGGDAGPQDEDRRAA